MLKQPVFLLVDLADTTNIQQIQLPSTYERRLLIRLPQVFSCKCKKCQSNFESQASSLPLNSMQELEGVNLDCAMAQHLLVAADRYALSRLRRICERRLCETVEVIVFFLSTLPSSKLTPDRMSAFKSNGYRTCVTRRYGSVHQDDVLLQSI